jgi:hypothetical protein
MKAFFGLVGFSLLLVYCLGFPLHGPAKQVRISDLTALSEKGVSPEEMSKLLIAQVTTTNPNSIISGNSPNVYSSGNSPFAVTQGNSPNVITRGNFPDRYSIGSATGSPNTTTYPMPKLNF